LTALNAHAEHEPDGDWFNRYGTWETDPNAGLEILDRDPHKLLENAEVMTAIRDCMDKLPPSLRQLYALRELDDREPAEICEATGVTRGSLAVLLHRARQLLRACLQKNFLQT
jgi:RNA polymerase sigma-70 factor (ECF subfamily)